MYKDTFATLFENHCFRSKIIHIESFTLLNPKLVAGCIPFSVNTENPIDGPSVEELETAALAAEAVRRKLNSSIMYQYYFLFFV